MEEKAEKPEVKLPKIKLKAPDLSKINLRKINWITVLGIMSYLHVFVLIPMIYAKKSPFVQFHARQGFALLFVWVLFAYSMLLPVIPWIFAWYLAVSIIGGIISVIKGQEKKLLWIGDKIS